jgi:hypothetical protein
MPWREWGATAKEVTAIENVVLGKSTSAKSGTAAPRARVWPSKRAFTKCTLTNYRK